MEPGVKLDCPSSCFSRYHFFYHHLDGFMSRLYKLVEKGELTTYITNGDRRLAELKEQCAHFEDHVTVSLFGDTDGACKSDLIGDKDEAIGICEEKTTLTEYLNDAYFHCHIAVCVFSTEKQFFDFKDQISNGTDDTSESIIFLNKETKLSHLVKDIAHVVNTPLVLPANRASSDPICKRIETVLETRLVEVMDIVATFVHKFVPNEKQHFEKKLMSLLKGRFLPFMRNVSVIADFSPDRGMPICMDNTQVDPSTLTEEGKTQIFHKKLMDFSTKKTTTILCEELAVRNGLPVPIAHELLSDDGFDLEKKISEKNKTIDIDPWPSEYGPEGAVYVCRKYGYDFTMALKDTVEEAETWTKKQLKYFDLMMKMEFELHGLFKQTKVSFRTVIPPIPKLPYELQCTLLELPKIASCGLRYGTLVLQISEQLDPSDIFTLNDVLQRHRYYLRYSIEGTFQFRELANTRKEFISHGDPIRAKRKRQVAECDDFYFGSIGCFVKIKSNLEENVTSKTKHGRKVSKVESTKCDMPVAVSDVHIVAKTTRTTQQTLHKADAKQPTNVSKPQQEKKIADDDKSLYAITCAHCVNGCVPNIEIDRHPDLHVNATAPNRYERFGHVDEAHTLCQPYYLDMTAIEVDVDIQQQCNLGALRSCGMKPVQTWKVYGEPPKSRMLVYMVSAVTGFNEGVIVDTNFMDKKLKDYNEHLRTQLETDGKEKALFNPRYSMLIATGVDVSNEGQKFSNPGDSGSMIWHMDADGKVFAVALLCGDVFEEPTSGTERYSYASNTKQLFETFEETFNSTIVPACSEEEISSPMEEAMGGVDVAPIHQGSQHKLM